MYTIRKEQISVLRQKIEFPYDTIGNLVRKNGNGKKLFEGRVREAFSLIETFNFGEVFFYHIQTNYQVENFKKRIYIKY